MMIRKEENSDFKRVYDLVKAAFETAKHSDGTEQDLVERLRKSESFIPELSLVAQENGDVIGHILFTKISIGERVEIALAPLSVCPKFQRKGVGKALILEGHKIAKDLGFTFSVVLGSEEYYPKFGYLPAINFGIKPPFDVPSENFMAINLKGDNTKIDGVVAYDKAF